ncbi:MAG: polymerase subunit sigma-24 [Actinomycetia bacterium]|nr:polymerase subunit sigma-24 [Actinomycetes bacterium]
MVATLARSFDLSTAEDAAAEAFVAALERWPETGVPDNPGAWLTTAARNRALDQVRRERTRPERQAAAHEQLAVRAEPAERAEVDDDVLRLVFTCCHPALALEAQIALTLRLIAGLGTPEVARAFFVPEATMAQRLVRAKKKIAAAGIPYRVPERDELPERLAGVLRVVYLVFREGYAPSGGPDVVRIDVCDEAIRLARLLADLLPDEAEVLGLLGLLLLHHSRRRTRTDGAGDVVLLADQDRAQWDHAAIAEGTLLAAGAVRRAPGPYALQAGIAACHAETPADWRTIAELYDRLARIDPSPAVTLNRAVAVAEVDGPDAGLAMVDSLLASPAGEAVARTSHQPHLVRADLLRRLGRTDESAAAYRRALGLATTEPERRFLARCLDELS